MQSNSKIYFSYAWGDDSETGAEREKVVNDLYQSLLADGYQVVRDKYDLKYKGLISKLTESIGRGNLIVIAISDKYLRSRYCMEELLEIYRRSNSDTEEMLKKTFPIVLKDAKIYSPEDRIEYLKYWEAKKNDLNLKLKDVALENAGAFTHELRLYDEISSVIPILSTFLNDINTLSPQKLSENNFEEIKRAIIATLATHPEATDRKSDTPGDANSGRSERRYLSFFNWKILIAGSALAISIIAFLYFVRLRSVDVTLDLVVSNVSFTLTRQQVLTSLMKFKRIGVSGLSGVQLPNDSSFTELNNGMRGSLQSAVLMSVDTQQEPEGTITLDNLALPDSMRVEIGQTDIPGNYRFSFAGREISYPVHLNGPVRIVLPPQKSGLIDFINPGVINLQSGKDDVDFDLDFLSSSNSVIEGPIDVKNISFLRIDEHVGNDMSIVQTVSTIVKGSVKYVSLKNKDYALQQTERLEFKQAEGNISKLRLEDNQIVLTFNGKVSGMTSALRKKSTNMMPTYLQWAKARPAFAFLLIALPICFVLGFSVLQFRRRKK